jgi:tetratricopeptide (TPR) repeat protein
MTSRIRLLCAILLLGSAGCDRMVTPRHSQQLKDAEAKVASGDFSRAISLYESALDDRPSDAEVHYKLGLIYDDKLNDPLNALHHYKRYLAIAPQGPRAVDVKNFIKRDEVALLTSLSGDAIISRAEATRLRNENLALHKQIDEARTRGALASPLSDSKSRKGGAEKRTYIVQHGDTLASISRKFYKTSAQWRRILEANRDVIDNPKNLTAGQKLVIPSR